MADFAQVKETQKFIWSQGDYPAVAEILWPSAEALVEACAVGPGMRVLDVAAGDGNVAIAAARRGAQVIASDITPELVDKGRARSEAEGLNIEWREADAEDLPFGSEEFDVVTSAFGAMFAPRAAHTARELMRVTKTGGKVGMTAWTPEGFIGQSFKAAAKYQPPPPEGADSHLSWGEEDAARSRFDPHASVVETSRGVVPWRFESVDAWLKWSQVHVPPVVVAKTMLPPDVFAEMEEENRARGEASNQATDGSFHVDGEYLLIVATK